MSQEQVPSFSWSMSIMGHQVAECQTADGQGVEYRLLDDNGDQLGPAFQYQVSALRTAKARAELLDLVNDETLRGDAQIALDILEVLGTRLTPAVEAQPPVVVAAPPAAKNPEPPATAVTIPETSPEEPPPAA